MSRWFQNRRQEFIAATLKQFGQIRRADIVRQFDVSMPQASNDIAEFMASDPPQVSYDVSAKAYVLNEADQPEICPECSREPVTKDGLCDDCWAFVNGPLGVGA